MFDSKIKILKAFEVANAITEGHRLGQRLSRIGSPFGDEILRTFLNEGFIECWTKDGIDVSPNFELVFQVLQHDLLGVMDAEEIPELEKQKLKEEIKNLKWDRWKNIASAAFDLLRQLSPQ